MTTNLRIAAGVLTASLALAGCGGGGGGGGEASPPSQSDSAGWGGTAPSSARPQAKTTPSPPSKRGSVVIDWLKKYTPAGGGHGPLDSIYAEFMQGDCEGTLAAARVTRRVEMEVPLDEPYRSLYEGAAAACLAAFHGRQGLWRTAEARFSSTRTRGIGCWQLAVYAIFEKLVRAHRADPDAVFVRGKATGSANCPELTGVHPDHGPRAGGYTVVVSGRRLPPTLKLYWAWDFEVTARKGADGVMRLKVPPAEPGQEAEASIMIADAPSIEAPVYATFTYDCANGKC